MSEDSLLMMNLYDVSKNRELLFTTGATLRRVFHSVAVLSRPDGNHIVFAFSREQPAASIRAQLERAQGVEQVTKLARQAAAGIVDRGPPFGTAVFTDDHPPVEEMTRRKLMSARPHR